MKVIFGRVIWTPRPPGQHGADADGVERKLQQGDPVDVGVVGHLAEDEPANARRDGDASDQGAAAVLQLDVFDVLDLKTHFVLILGDIFMTMLDSY